MVLGGGARPVRGASRNRQQTIDSNNQENPWTDDSDADQEDINDENLKNLKTIFAGQEPNEFSDELSKSPSKKGKI